MKDPVGVAAGKCRINGVAVGAGLAVVGLVQVVAAGGIDELRIAGPFSHYQTFAGVLLLCDLLALAALGLTKPDIAFYFHKGGKLAEQRVVDQRVSAVMDGISAACAQTHSMYMLRQPYEGNRLAEIVCKSAAQAGDDCPILGLFHLGNLTRIDESRDADVRDEAFFEKLRDFCA